MSKDNGGPAFSAPGITGYENANGEIQYVNWPGMTLRDWFAAKAMQGWMANGELPDEQPDVVARLAYRMADAMLAERNKP